MAPTENATSGSSAGDEDALIQQIAARVPLAHRGEFEKMLRTPGTTVGSADPQAAQWLSELHALRNSRVANTPRSEPALRANRAGKSKRPGGQFILVTVALVPSAETDGKRVVLVRHTNDQGSPTVLIREDGSNLDDLAVGLSAAQKSIALHGDTPTVETRVAVEKQAKSSSLSTVLRQEIWDELRSKPKAAGLLGSTPIRSMKIAVRRPTPPGAAATSP